MDHTITPQLTDSIHKTEYFLNSSSYTYLSINRVLSFDGTQSPNKASFVNQSQESPKIPFRYIPDINFPKICNDKVSWIYSICTILVIEISQVLYTLLVTRVQTLKKLMLDHSQLKKRWDDLKFLIPRW